MVKGHERLNLAFVANLFNMHPGLEPPAEVIIDHHNIIVASDVDHDCVHIDDIGVDIEFVDVGVGGGDIFGLMVMIIRMIRSDGKKVESDDDDDDDDKDDDSYIMMIRTMFVCI